MKVCGYCRWYQGYANKRQYGICKNGKSNFPDNGTFSTNTCPFFEHWKTDKIKDDGKGLVWPDGKEFDYTP